MSFYLVLSLLAPFSVLPNTAAGQAALAANLQVTEAIQRGTAGQPALQSFADQQAQALKDAFITFGNANELADGLGTTLSGVYQAATTVTMGADGKPKFPNIAPSVKTLILYSATLTAADSNAGKYFFSNGTQKTSDAPAAPAPADEMAIMSRAGGVVDVFGKAYHHPAGSPGADPFGDSRPFQVAPDFLKFSDPDFFGKTASNDDYLDGPVQTLTSSPSFPSGHTTYGYTESLLLAIMVPQRYTQMITRAGDYGNHRIVMGAHYAMDVIGGRTVAYDDVAQMLAGKPDFVGRRQGKAAPITDYGAAVRAAAADLNKALRAGCGKTVASCAAEDTGRFKNPTVNKAFYESTMTYGLPVVYPAMAGKTEDVGTVAPEAGYLLTAAFPALSLRQADLILTQTEGPGGGFLDDGSAMGVYSRLDLYRAGWKVLMMERPKG